MALQLRLDPDVARMAATMAKRNSRTAPREVNHVLREYYTADRCCAGLGQSADGSALRFNTVLDPTPRAHNHAWTEAPLNLSFGATKKSYPKMAAFAKKMKKRYNDKMK